jgi:pimeloyl-ACP methyl ester carboxylesterase
MVSASELSVQAGIPRRGGPRRWLRRLLVALAAVLVLVVAAAAGIAWYFSGVALAVDHVETYPATVLPAAGPADAGGRATIRLSRDPDTSEAGTVLGLSWAGGYGQVGPVVAQDATSVTRTFTAVGAGRPAPGTKVRVDSNTFAGDPRSALGLDFADVRIAGPLGELPAWYVPAAPPASGQVGAASGQAGAASGQAGAAAADLGDGRTWVVFVHGHDGDRQESLRYLRSWHALGLPVLVTDYRDDVGAPSSPDHFHHLGDTEWQDVSAAVHWARDHGAQGVVLAGWSMGGAVALQTAARSDVAGMIRGLLLDSPVIDWRNVFATQGADRGLPGVEVTFAEWALQWRSGISLDRLDWVSRAGQLKVPTLIIHSDSDDYVPDGPAARLAAARPDLVTLVRIPGARHTLGWNVNPARYDAAVRDWLTRLLG